MGRRGGGDNSNQIALQSQYSSIAMLQERFRQLEKAKEIRQERELLMMKNLSSSLSSSSFRDDHSGPLRPLPNNRVRRAVNAELLLFPAAAAKPSPRLSFSLWPGADSPVRGFRPGGQTHPAHTTVHGWVMSINKHDHDDDDGHDYCDVDTSLHL